MKIVLSIAGSDPSAGAGIQQDLKVITAMGCYGATVLTAITSQNTLGVQDVMPLPASVVASQLDAVFSDLDVAAVKIGQIPDDQVAEAVAQHLRRYLANHPVPVIYDPVMISTSGHDLMSPTCVGSVVQFLFPLSTLITPNLPEAARLTGQRVLHDESDIVVAGRTLADRYHSAVLLKGGHSQENALKNRLFLTDGTQLTYASSRIDTPNLHGTGCALSSAIASALALGQSLPEAVSTATAFVHEAIRKGRSLQIGHGDGPIWNF